MCGDSVSGGNEDCQTVGAWRGKFPVFYDVEETEQTATVRAVRHKPPHASTEEIL